MKLVKVSSIKYIGKRKAYNISMKKNRNFFLENGILTHNTNDAQNALRRTIEKYSKNTRFILSCNYPHKIIKPIQSRLTRFHFTPLGINDINAIIDKLCASKNIKVSPEIRDILFRYSQGDARQVINALQSASMISPEISKEVIQVFTQTPDMESAKLIIATAVSGDFISAREMFMNLYISKGFDYEIICETLLDACRTIKYTEDTNRNNRIIATINAIVSNHSHFMYSSNPRVEFSGILAKISMIEKINQLQEVVV